MENRKLTVGDLRDMFNSQTRIFVTNRVSDKTESYTERIDKIEITYNYLLLGTYSFCGIPIHDNNIYVVGKNKVEVELDMPEAVFLAWAEYAKKNGK